VAAQLLVYGVTPPWKEFRMVPPLVACLLMADVVEGSEGEADGGFGGVAPALAEVGDDHRLRGVRRGAVDVDEPVERIAAAAVGDGDRGASVDGVGEQAVGGPVHVPDSEAVVRNCRVSVSPATLAIQILPGVDVEGVLGAGEGRRDEPVDLGGFVSDAPESFPASEAAFAAVDAAVGHRPRPEAGHIGVQPF
jgi:hypothetical protein